MKVNVKINCEVVNGYLTTTYRQQIAHFISEDKKHRIIMERPEIMICGEEDHNSIWIAGDEKIDDKTFRKINYVFYPVN